MISEIKSTVNNYEIGSPIPSINTEEFDLLLNNIAADDCVREDDFVSLPMMPPPPKARYNLGICCGSSNLLHKVSVLVGLPFSCSC